MGGPERAGGVQKLQWQCWLGFRTWCLGVRGTTPIMENQMEKNMDNEMETGIIQGLGFPKIRSALMSRGFGLYTLVRRRIPFSFSRGLTTKTPEAHLQRFAITSESQSHTQYVCRDPCL